MTKLDKEGEKLSKVVRIQSKRKTSGVVFMTAREKFEEIQLGVRKSLNPELYEKASGITAGSLLEIEGSWERKERGGLFFLLTEIRVMQNYSHAWVDKHHGMSEVKRRERRSLDLASNLAYFQYQRFCAEVLHISRDELRLRGYVEYNTGVLQSVFEAGMAEPFETTCLSNGKQMFLSLTSELKLKRLISAGETKVCEIAQSFRNEGLGKFHSPEFTLMEAYGVGAKCEDMKSIARSILIRAREQARSAGYDPDLSWFESDEFIELEYGEVCQRFFGKSEMTLKDLCQKYPELFVEGMPYFTWFLKFFEVVFAPTVTQPTFVNGLPAGISPLVKRKPNDPDLTERSFFFAKGIYLADIYEDENDPAILKRELDKQAEMTGRETSPDYLDCVDLGMPDTAGIGLGMNRVQLLFTPEELPWNIRETILFPLG